MSDAQEALSSNGALTLDFNDLATKRRRQRKWTRAENESIAKMREAGKPIKQIAAAHRANVNQIASKLYVWGMCKPHRPRVEAWERDWRNPAPLARQIQQRSEK